MKKSRFTESQIVGILKEADSGVAVNEIWRKHRISSLFPPNLLFISNRINDKTRPNSPLDKNRLSTLKMGSYQ